MLVKVVSRLVLAVVLFAGMGALSPRPAIATAGVTEYRITASTNSSSTQASYGDVSVEPDTSWSEFTEAVDPDSWRSDSGTFQVGFECQATAGKYARLYRQILLFDISSANISSLDDIEYVDLWLKLQSLEDGNSWNPAVGIVAISEPSAMANWPGGEVNSLDYDLANSTDGVAYLVATYGEYNVGDWVQFPIHPDALDEIIDLDEDLAYLAVVELNYDWLDIAPSWANAGAAYQNYYSQDTADPDDRPYLLIRAESTPTDGTSATRTNGPIDTSVTGEERVTSISWDTPRLAYSSEALKFIFAGDSGAVVEAELRDSNDVLLADVTDSVRTDGYFYWTANLPISFSGYVRVGEAVSSVASVWGHVSEGPDSTELVGYTYVNGTEHANVEGSVSQFVVQEPEVFEVHWKTAVGTADFDIANLELWFLGDRDTSVYSSNLSGLSDTYFVNHSDNDAMNAWRYALFAMDTGAQPYGSLIIDLGQPYNGVNSGWYQPVIYDTDTAAEATTSRNAVWYLARDTDAPGINYTVSGSSVDFTFQSAPSAKVEETINQWRVDMRPSGSAVGFGGGAEVMAGIASCSTSKPSVAGEYDVTFTLSNPGWSYVHRGSTTDYTTTGGGGPVAPGGGGWFNWLTDPIAQVNTMSALAKAAIVLIALFFCVWVTRKAPGITKAILPVTALAMFIVFGWLPAWAVALAAALVGVFLYSWLRKRTEGSTNE